MTIKKTTGCTYQIVAELKDFKPRVWRRFLINADLPLAELGYAMIAMFEGQASHLFHFWHPKQYDLYYTCACCISPEALGLGPAHHKMVDARSVTISKALPEVGSTLNFEYDFGDGWNFKIKLEKIITESSKTKILRGVGYGILEDCGGVGGLYHIVELCANKTGHEYEELAEWYGLADFDIKKFDDDLLNEAILDREIVMIRNAYENPPR